jgi:hypothetical protein
MLEQIVPDLEGIDSYDPDTEMNTGRLGSFKMLESARGPSTPILYIMLAPEHYCYLPRRGGSLQRCFFRVFRILDIFIRIRIKILFII